MVDGRAGVNQTHTVDKCLEVRVHTDTGQVNKVRVGVSLVLGQAVWEARPLFSLLA